MSFIPQGVSPFLPGNNYMKLDYGVKKEVDRSLILRKKNNKINYKKCSDNELLDLLKKNEELLNNKELLAKLPDKGEKIHIKNKEIKEEISNRNITIEKKKNNDVDNNNKDKDTPTENENKSTNSNTENQKDNEDINVMEIESLNQKFKTIDISDNTDNINIKAPKVKRGQAKIAEKILQNSTINNSSFMIRHEPNKSHSKIISIQESLELQIQQRKIQKEIEINEAKKRLKKTIMSTGPVKFHSTEYRNTNNEFDDDDNDDDAIDHNNNEFNDNDSYYDDSSDAEADEFLFGYK
ncbi:hypothetical protein BCR36DRAFT_354317 [Piromyces finnis]|uniref:Uncharacterized protein n=1 Tax=Piromyces finnis TaxID=1754191 RepID=A0A1Y1V6Z1_9FUNG|nr:hypothetical protein BCR36DRAFT_354317 [Piromyces finnis]|eukprot:ORX48615.1 hypothetical protein BCR36DRAFT_354317 [Piromyces finnis]